MSVHSGGILLFNFVEGKLAVMLVHPGGPFWAKKDEGAWSVPKGILEETERGLEAARREFKEETGFDVDGQFIELWQLKQPSDKIIHARALESELDAKDIQQHV